MTQILPADVVAVDQVHVVIICPICGKFHWHGSNGITTDLNYGTRVPHCTGDDAGRFRGQYELITSEQTIRRDKLRPQDIEAWRDVQRSKRATLEDQWEAQEAEEQDAKILAAVRELHAQGRKLTRWKIATHASVPERSVTSWMHRHGIYYGGGRYQVISRSRAGPELCKIWTMIDTNELKALRAKRLELIKNIATAADQIAALDCEIEAIQMDYQLTLRWAGDFPGSPEQDTVEISDAEYDELWARFIKPKAIAEGWCMAGDGRPRDDRT